MEVLRGLGERSAHAAAPRTFALPSVWGESVVHTQPCMVLREELVPARACVTADALQITTGGDDDARHAGYAELEGRDVYVVLHGDYLCWYASAQSTHLLLGHMDVHAIEVDAVGADAWAAATPQKRYVFGSEERDVWIEALLRARTQAQEPARVTYSVLCIPLERIVDIADAPRAMGVPLVGVRVLAGDAASWDDYYLAELPDRAGLLDAVAKAAAQLGGPEAPLPASLEALPFAPWSWSPRLVPRVLWARAQNGGDVVWQTQQVEPPTEDSLPSLAEALRTSLLDSDELSDSNGLAGPRSDVAQSAAGSNLAHSVELADAPEPPASFFEHDTPSPSGSDVSLVSVPDATDTWAQAELAAHFPDLDEPVVGHVRATLLRTVPVPGRVFVTERGLAFRSSAFYSRVLGRTALVLHASELVSVSREYDAAYARPILVLVVRGREEQFLAFATRARLEQCYSLLSHAIAACAAEHASDVPPEAPRPPPMHITLLTIGSRGDVQPYIALAQRLQSHGHTVRIATHAEFRPWVLSYGVAEFAEVGGDPALLMRLCIEQGTFSLGFVYTSLGMFRTWLDELLTSSWAACQGTDVLVESPSAQAGVHVAERLGIPYMRAFTMPWTATRAYPHAFAVPKRHAGGHYNALTYALFELFLWRASAPQINAWRRTLGLAATTLEQLHLDEVPMLYSFSSQIVPKPLDWSAHTHVTGYWFVDEATPAPPEALVRFLEGAKKAQGKLVYIGWGSIIVPDAHRVTEAVYDAVDASGVYAVLAKGWSDRSASAPAAPRNHPRVFCVESVRHDWLFPQMDAVCHHGGAGTVGASLRAGTPVVLHPFFGDQFFWARQVESLGIGVRLDALTAHALTAALIKATGDVAMAAAAQRIGEAVRAEDGVGRAVAALYAELPTPLAQSWCIIDKEL